MNSRQRKIRNKRMLHNMNSIAACFETLIKMVERGDTEQAVQEMRDSIHVIRTRGDMQEMGK